VAFSRGAPTDRDSTLQAPADLYAYPDPMPPRGWVRANMVSSLDGSASGADGVSGSVSSPVDKAPSGCCGGLADVILVGASTVRTEGYRTPTAELFHGASPTYVATTATSDLAPLRKLVTGDHVIVAWNVDLEVDDAVNVLAARGLTGSCSKAARRCSAALAANRVEEVCLTWSPPRTCCWGAGWFSTSRTTERGSGSVIGSTADSSPALDEGRCPPRRRAGSADD